jgi:hypothetical protein
VTIGTDIYFGAGQDAPGTPGGDALIAHETTHARQFREGRVPMCGGMSTPADPLEREAFAASARVIGLPMNVFHHGHAIGPTAAALAGPGAGPMILRRDRDPLTGEFTALGRFGFGVELLSRGVAFDQLGDLGALSYLSGRLPRNRRHLKTRVSAASAGCSHAEEAAE